MVNSSQIDMVEESTLDVLAGLSSLQYICSQAEAVAPMMLSVMRDRGYCATFRRYHRASVHQAQQVDKYFSTLGNEPETLDYAIIMKYFAPHFNALETISQESEKGQIDAVDACVHLSVVFGAIKGLQFLKRHVELRRNNRPQLLR